jgi:perosamine synthetase
MPEKIERTGKLEREYVSEVLDSQFHSSKGGMMTSRREKSFAERFNMKYAICFINGTATMHAVLVGSGTAALIAILRILVKREEIL